MNSSATIVCAHGGQVQIVPKQTTVLIGGSPAIRETDLMGAPIVGCAQPPTISSKPCTMVVSIMPGGAATKVMAGGMPPHTQPLTGMTDGVPPGTVMVVNPGQTTVQGN